MFYSDRRFFECDYRMGHDIHRILLKAGERIITLYCRCLIETRCWTTRESLPVYPNAFSLPIRQGVLLDVRYRLHDWHRQINIVE